MVGFIQVLLILISVQLQFELFVHVKELSLNNISTLFSHNLSMITSIRTEIQSCMHSYAYQVMKYKLCMENCSVWVCSIA